VNVPSTFPQPCGTNLSTSLSNIIDTFRQVAVEGNQAFWMVHTGTLCVTNTEVSANGTIATTWRVDDQFDYLPDWDNPARQANNSYYAYNHFAQIASFFYHSFLRAPQYPTNAYWDETIPPVEE